jgi:hypothetical protein
LIEIESIEFSNIDELTNGAFFLLNRKMFEKEAFLFGHFDTAGKK